MTGMLPVILELLEKTNKQKNPVQLLWMDELARKTQNTTRVFYTRVQMFISALKLTMLNM